MRVIWLRLRIRWISMICLCFWSIIVVARGGKLGCWCFTSRLRSFGFCLCWCWLFTAIAQGFGSTSIFGWISYGYWGVGCLIGVLSAVFRVRSVDVRPEGLVSSLTIRFRSAWFANCWSEFGCWSLKQRFNSLALHFIILFIYFTINKLTMIF